MSQPHKKQAGKYSIKPKEQDMPVGTIRCDNGHEFRFADYHQKIIDGELKYVFTGFCWGCGNSLYLIRDEIPRGLSRDYRNNTFIEP